MSDLRTEAAEHGVSYREFGDAHYITWLETELLAVRHTLLQVQHAYAALENALTRVERDQ